jgi:hypothetical protein
MDEDIVIKSADLDAATNELAQNIIDEQDLSKIKDLTQLFNVNLAKKNIVRLLKYSDLVDKVSDQMMKRVISKPGEFSNEDLLKYLQITQSAIDKSTKSSGIVEDIPAINLIQKNTQVNINTEPKLDREARQRVTDAVSAILAKLNSENNIIYTDEVDEKGDNDD